LIHLRQNLVKSLMASQSKINIVSLRPSEFNSEITIAGMTYHIQTEDQGMKTCTIISRVYSKGEIVLSKKSEYGHLSSLRDRDEKIRLLMEGLHRFTVKTFLETLQGREKTKSEYFSELKEALLGSDGDAALDTARKALDKFPSDPLLLSYYGVLVATVRNDPREGIKICRDAILMLQDAIPFGSEFFYPVFYLNLGKAYLQGKRKREAITAFRRGLKSDPENRELLNELKNLGVRKRPALPFLDRGNPVNKYIGKLMSRSGK